MNYQEYLQRIESVFKAIYENRTKEAEKELELLNGVFPKSVGFYSARALLELKLTKDSKKVFGMIGGILHYIYEYPFVKEGMDVLKLAGENINSRWIPDNYQYTYELICDSERPYKVVDSVCVREDSYENNVSILKELYDALDAFAYVLHRKFCEKKYAQISSVWDPEHIYQRTNMSVFVEALSQKKPMVLIETEAYSTVTRLLAKDLKYMDIPVCYVRQPQVIEESNISKAWEITLDSVKMEGRVTYITPICVKLSDGYFTNNIDDVIKYAKEVVFEEKIIGVLSDMITLEELSVTKTLCKNFYKITTGMMSKPYRCLNYALYGEYMSYISDIYLEDAEALINRKSEKRFSIIIPARNSSHTLGYTIRTCLNQSYTGSYEIIISDNSTGQNAAVFELCKELNDERIVYIKTPRDLVLPKSFEYAYLHARGEYIFAIGSDDGLLPWALEELDKVISTYPEEKIIQWERGFYAWPGFNGGQENQYEIHRAYSRENYEIFYKDGADYLAEAMIRPETMYSLPMLYINSCFKREYFKILLEKTGRLWDGVCQDIYIGVVNAVINPRILNMEIPLTIAGMSNGSVGATSNRGIHTNEEFNKIQAQRILDGNVGGYYETYYEKLCPPTGTDTYSLYKTILRMISIGLLPEIYLDQVIPWKEWYIRLTAELDIMDVSFDAKIHEMRYCASLLGEDFLDWFDKGIYYVKTAPREIKPDTGGRTQSKTYTEGRIKQGGVILDASKYGVENIYDAVQLFDKIIEEGVEKYY